MALTQTQLAAAVADRAEISKAEAKRVLSALDEIVLEELGNAQKVRIGGLVQLTVRVKPAQKARKGRNPATGEEIEIAAKSAASICAPVRSPRPRRRFPQCRRRVGAWLAEQRHPGARSTISRLTAGPGASPRSADQLWCARPAHHRREARKRRPSRATARTGQGGAAVGAEGPPATRRVGLL